ncbi:cytochrome-c peroxidase [Pedobacter sp. BAL39]|uniref:cytochrome-c peroxidase n=1 Tax=Pedobacter sp. BAL39 TaxID=391596 RepID=UPI0001559725|nr:cytochrome c peroxidase [Pedobacter sp. BAL39]EDM36704.1 cytochrome-c peroxidase [Pedobacter sp. BAL39]
MKRLLPLFLFLGCFVLFTAFLQEDYSIEELRGLYGGPSSGWPMPHLDEESKPGFQDIGQLEKPAYPADNPYSAEKEKLGKLLFFDPRMSVSGQIACASCHDPELGWGDGKRVAYGHSRQNGKRNAMTILNTAYYNQLFWDGRAGSLEHQATFPVQDQVEMNTSLRAMVKNISRIKGYQPLFKAVYGSKEVSIDKIQHAIATFERSILSRHSRFDAFMRGNKQALKDEELLGLHLFRTKARCINCHNTPLFSDNQFHNDGQTLLGSKMQDLGRYQHTGQLSDVGKFRTPSLRETNISGPWMHHGNFPSLMDVIEYYNLGNPSPIQRGAMVPDALKRYGTSARLQKLSLTKKEKAALEAFLKSISTQVNKIMPPALPR